ncbi:carbohydrate ABC transporter permease [Breznakiella homolactica]|uniref:carbohydrate ABC transporter permease n=1 Tax=Breznakiella homolactica TaxID=2798577 RepID=UPI001CBA65B2|nr:sugar ABC transporter permease [Breznakiella homolactica]
MTRNKLRSALSPVLFVLPCAILLIMFIYFPLIQNIIFSFFRFSAFSPSKLFIGIQNYSNLIRDGIVATALQNNFRYAVVSVLCQVCFGLVLAAILEDQAFKRVAVFFRTTFFLPIVISITVVCLLFGFIYNPMDGLLNKFLELIGLGALTRPWLGSAKTAIWATIAVSQWHSTGYVMMLFIVAIQKIPGELYEAAEIDGAGKLRRFFLITLPQVREMFFVTSVITVTGSVLVFNEPYILTKGGGPGTSSITMSVYMYQSGFFKDMMGYAAALAVVIFVISAILAVIQMTAFRSGED